ncbi:MAG: hypothetical protein ABI898_11785 [Sphingomonadales bacterium]
MANTRLVPTILLVLVLILALGLRLLDAGGTLWVDEAWSVVNAGRVAPFTGIFLDINHDNNHHLNSLWIQLIGPEGSPLAYRALSIATSVATVAVAAMIAGRHSRIAALTTALLFAVAPMFVIVGSEARGYAPMLLMTLFAVAVTDRWIADPSRPMPRALLAVIATAGTLAHLGFALALPGLALWTMTSLTKTRSVRGAIDAAVSLWLPSGIFCFSMIAAVILIALTRTGALTVGGYEAYSTALFVRALSNLAFLITGIGWVGVVAIAALSSFRGARNRLSILCGFLAVTLPLIVLILRPGNSGIERYYILTGMALLLYAGLKTGILIDAGGGRRWVAVGVLALLVSGSLVEDSRQIAGGRGAPENAIAAIARLAPSGAIVASQSVADVPVLSLAAEKAAYPLKVATDCRAASFRFVGQITGPTEKRWCGRYWRQIAAGQARMPSGASWQLFVHDDLPSGTTAVSSPPSKRDDRISIRRAGVAQG